jgi:hypothetical protein
MTLLYLLVALAGPAAAQTASQPDVPTAVQPTVQTLAQSGPQADPQAAPFLGDVLLYRLFLKDGSFLVSYGEYARVGRDVVLSMPLGPDPAAPDLQLITVAADDVDWERTDRYSQSVRYQHYASTRAEDDFAVLSAEIAAMLNEISLTSDRGRAMQIADEARHRLAAWPGEHLGYRAADVADIIGLIDDAMRKIGGTSESSIQLSLVATATVPLEPVLGLPTPREQVRRLVTLVGLTPRAADRVALMRAALALMEDERSGISRDESADLRRSLEDRIRDELSTDAAYARNSNRLLDAAQQAALAGRVSGVQRVLDSVQEEDARLGSKRPEAVAALRAALEAKLDATREFRLKYDQWTQRRRIYRRYVDSISARVAQLVKAQSSLEAIRTLDGPAPKRLERLQRALGGGVAELEEIVPPEQLRSTHDLLITAWRFALGAVEGRLKAVSSGDLPTAWQASSAAAGAMLLLTRAQGEMRDALKPPVFRD